ncbi:choline/ethanolamine kinase, putative [Theileria equi strain WA]|uniref:Choline/ethanolamine kinase, putative n=1 Tax=Theileria equi strain WA TaxID=1537102 RepID=L1LGK6_THEEQ|nr:choline/ethanolamine kinase, putative [Theileria equi strain WA]EKX74414.1 choline/ethanolamine kinase, putative [Theileria equi strain WA]|eukprot:XP_004833866.1 choline/ethanolamine kinase, putative [Theileria equi strain WA]
MANSGSCAGSEERTMEGKVSLDDKKDFSSAESDADLYIENESELKDLCIKNMAFGNKLTPNDIHITRLGHAMTNHVYKVKIARCDPSMPLNLILKISTPYTSTIYDKGLQDEVSEVLGSARCGPRILSNFSCGMIQEYIDGHPLDFDLCLNISTLTSIASEVGKFHRRATAAAPSHWNRTPILWRKIDGWIPIARRMVSDNSLDIDIEGIAECCNSFRKILDNHIKLSNSPSNTILFCHNDLCGKNIIRTAHGIRLIDFDYSGFNYAGSDIAKFFSEISTRYHGVYPYVSIYDSLDVDHEIKVMFISIYLSEVLGKNVPPSDKLVEEFITSLQIHILGITLFWCLWGITMAERPESELSVEKDAFLHCARYRYKYYKDNARKLLEAGIIPGSLENQ